MNDRGKSDSPVVPAKPPNKTSVAEVVEGRGLAKGNTASKTRPGRGAGPGAPSALERVREVARTDKGARFTALLHHVDLARLRAAYRAIRPQAAPGVDGVTWVEYGQDLEANLRDLHARVQAGRYRAKPSRRVHIPKADGRLRPLGIASLEDKIVQRAVVEVLNAVYEVDFRGFSYGFRSGRGPHDALDALAVGIGRKKVNWVLDADIRVEHPVHLLPPDPHRQRVQRIMRTTPRPETVGEAPEVHLVDGVQHLDDGPLDDLVLQRGDTERPQPPVRLRDVYPPARFGPVAPRLNTCVQIPQIRLQVLPVFNPRHPIHPRSRLRADRPVGRPEPGQVDVMQQRREPRSLICSCHFTHTLQRTGRAWS